MEDVKNNFVVHCAWSLIGLATGCGGWATGMPLWSIIAGWVLVVGICQTAIIKAHEPKTDDSTDRRADAGEEEWGAPEPKEATKPIEGTIN